MIGTLAVIVGGGVVVLAGIGLVLWQVVKNPETNPYGAEDHDHTECRS